MLPEALSGDAASLKANVDRRTLSAILEVGADGTVSAERFASTWVRSRRFFTYEEVQAVLDRKLTIEPELEAALRAMEDCAHALNARRMKRGALDLDLPESVVSVDAEGHPLAVRRRERLFAHRLIEEFMLAANEAVARHLERTRTAFVYRIHEAPDERAIADLVPRLRAFGLRLPHDGADVRPRDLQAVIERVRGKPIERVVNLLVLRSMQQARYSPYKQIHFGLASDCYTHFTSPIRRYPDLVTHRALRASLERERTALPGAGALEPVAELASRRERRAMEAERDVARAAGILVMQHHVGKSFEGTVVHVDRNGYAVELDELFVEGFVPVGRLTEYYTFVSERVELQSRTSSRAIRLGDRARVRVLAAELAGRRLELAPIEK
jgi:ribonuclease R